MMKDTYVVSDRNRERRLNKLKCLIIGLELLHSIMNRPKPIRHNLIYLFSVIRILYPRRNQICVTLYIVRAGFEAGLHDWNAEGSNGTY